MTAEQRLKELPKAIIKWYEIEKGGKIACVISEQGNSSLIAEALEEKELDVKRIPLCRLNDKESQSYVKDIYDIVIAIDIIEYAQNVAQVLRYAKKMLKPDGKILLTADNRLGIRYFCGDQDKFTGKNYDGVENYRHLLPWERSFMQGRAYSKAELVRLLEEAGFFRYRFFSVFPRIENPQLLLSEDYEPNEAIDIRIFPEYNNPDTVFLLEEELYPALMENKMLHPMANGFFIECPLKSDYSKVNQVTLSGERGPENAMATIIRKDGFVEKRALYRAGEKKLRQLTENHRYLSEHGVRMIDAWFAEHALVMPYVSGVPANDYFRNLFESDQTAFLRQLDIFWNIILQSSEHASFSEVNWEQFEPGWEKRKKDDPNRDKWKKIASGSQQEEDDLGVILKRGYLDLVSLNSFFLDGSFVFYDQELYIENVPAKAVMLRTIDFIYKFNDQYNKIIPKNRLFERYGISKYKDLYNKFINYFLNILRNDDGLSDYFKEGRREYDIVLENRRRMNYAEEQYPAIFKNIFHHTIGRKLYLFGSGRYAQRFREKYEEIYPAAGYLDNDETRWDTEVEGLPVFSPAKLKEMNPAEYKVMICIKNYMPVVRQLCKMRIPNFSVYDPQMTYTDREASGRPTEKTPSVKENKKYHVGYVAGVFDLFHIGHLNLLRRAKEQCDYLIVGVVTDEGVIRHKKTNPHIPFEERIEIVRACRYVDEAVEIPLNQGDTDEAYRRYKFDAQFSGSDYADDPKWLAKKDFLQRHGADLVFFPYTDGISTTQLKDMVRGEEE